MSELDKTPPGANPGLLYVHSKIVKPDTLSPEKYTEWYEKVHIPDIFKTNGINEAFRWEAVPSPMNPEPERPYLALYPLKDVNYLQSAEFKSIPVKDPNLPGSGDIYDLANFDTRNYKFVQLYIEDDGKKTQPDFVMSAGFTPADDEDYDNYYRQQHLAEVARITGWRKTERYELLSARENRLPPEEKTIPDPPKFLTLHYFDGKELPYDELLKLGEVDWTKQIMASMKDAKVTVFKKLSHHQK